MKNDTGKNDNINNEDFKSTGQDIKTKSGGNFGFEDKNAEKFVEREEVILSALEQIRKDRLKPIIKTISELTGIKERGLYYKAWIKPELDKIKEEQKNQKEKKQIQFPSTSELHKKITKLRDDNTKLFNELDYEKSQNTILKRENATLSKKNTVLEVDNDNLKKHIANLNKKIISLQDELKNQNNLILPSKIINLDNYNQTGM